MGKNLNRDDGGLKRNVKKWRPFNQFHKVVVNKVRAMCKNSVIIHIIYEFNQHMSWIQRVTKKSMLSLRLLLFF